MAMPNLAVVLQVVLTQVELDATLRQTDLQEGLRLHVKNVHMGERATRSVKMR